MTTKSFLKARFTAALAHKHATATKAVVTNSVEEVESRLNKDKEESRRDSEPIETSKDSGRKSEVKALVRETALTEEDLKGLIIKKEKPGKPEAAKKFIDKKPSARVIGVNLLEELYKKEQVGKVLATKDSTTTATDDEEESVGEETRLTTQMRSSLHVHDEHRTPRVTKHVSFYGVGGAECTHIFLYEAVKVRLPWTGPKLEGKKEDKSGQWLRQQAMAAGAVRSAARPRLF